MTYTVEQARHATETGEWECVKCDKPTFKRWLCDDCKTMTDAEAYAAARGVVDRLLLRWVLSMAPMAATTEWGRKR